MGLGRATPLQRELQRVICSGRIAFSALDLLHSGLFRHWDFERDLLSPATAVPWGWNCVEFLVPPCKLKLAAPQLKMREAVIDSILYAGNVTFGLLAISHTVSLQQHLSILGSASE